MFRASTEKFQVVALVGGVATASSARTAATTAAAAAATTAHSTHARGHTARAHAAATAGAIAASAGNHFTETPGFRQAHVGCKASRPTAVVPGNDGVASAGTEIEIAVLGALDVLVAGVAK